MCHTQLEYFGSICKKIASTLNEFKGKLNAKMTMKNVYYNLGCRCVNSILARMRIYCFQLNSHLDRNSITPNKLS